MASSGIIPFSTNGDSPVTLIAASNTVHKTAVIINNSTVQGFCSIDSGVNWIFLPAAATAGSAPGVVYIPDTIINNKSIMVKRVPGGTDLTGLYANLLA